MNSYSNILAYLKTTSPKKPEHELGLIVLISFILVFLENI